MNNGPAPRLPRSKPKPAPTAGRLRPHRPGRWLAVLLALLMCALMAGPALAAEPVELVAPAPDSRIIAKRPQIKCTLSLPPGTKLLVVLDNVDVTGAIKRTATDFTYTPLEPLESGQHVLTVGLVEPDGSETEIEYQFHTRQTSGFEQASAKVRLSGVYQGALYKSSGMSDTPGSRVESNLAAMLRAKEGAWKFDFNANLRQMDQSTPSQSGWDKGVDLDSYLLQVLYKKPKGSVTFQFGDLVVSETENTAWQLSRRGALIGLDYRALSVRAFMVNSPYYQGFEGGVGLADNVEDHTTGVSLRLKPLGKKLEFTAVYMRGGKKTEGDGEWMDALNERGEVLGLAVTADFLDKVLVARFEVDFSRFDYDTTDDEDPYNDKAYTIEFAGRWKEIYYGAAYQHFGTDYAVVNNYMIEPDRAGYTLESGGDHSAFAWAVLFSEFQDNLAGDRTQPDTRLTQLNTDLTYQGFEKFPLSFSYAYAREHTSQEPEDYPSMDLNTHTLSATAGWNAEPFFLMAMASYSHQYDRMEQENNSISTTFSLTPAMQFKSLTVSPGLTYTRTEMEFSEESTRIYTVNLDLRGGFGKTPRSGVRLFTYALSGAYNRIMSNDDASDSSSLDATLDFNYVLAENLFGGLTPTVGLRFNYTKFTDNTGDEDEEDLGVFLIITADWNLAF